MTTLDITSIKQSINKRFNDIENKTNTISNILLELNRVPDTTNVSEINYWKEINKNLILYIEGWNDECLSGTGFPKIHEGGTEEKIDYIQDLTPKILEIKGYEKNMELITGGFYETPDMTNLYGITWGLYKNK